MNADEEHTRSLWMEIEVAKASPLDGDQKTDVVIIGGGMAGLSLAYELTARGRKVIVLDRGKIAGGMTARTTAHLVSALDDRYHEIIKTHGVDVARIVYQSQAAAINRLEEIQDSEHIDCDFQRLNGYLFLAPGCPASDLDEELSACAEANVPVADCHERMPLHAKNLVRSLRFPNQARFHPLKYLRGLVKAVERQGGRFFANTAVEGAEEEKDGVTVKTERGTIRAADVVFATNSPIGGAVSIHTKQAPYRTFAVAATLPRNALEDALYWDTLDPYHYVRLQPHSDRANIVIIGGADYKSGEHDDGEARFAKLEEWARERLPEMGKIMHRWSGQILEPVDYLGFVGRNPGDKHRYLVTGDSGQGLTNGLIASLLITDLITTGQSSWQKAFDPGRSVAHTLGAYVSENLTAVKSTVEHLTPGEIASPQQLRPGEGGIYRSGLKKVAVCRDMEGALHLRSATCTHMGCIVHWNSLEQCWDCPCHGSQFAASGAVLNGPAVHALEEIEQTENLAAE